MRKPDNQDTLIVDCDRCELRDNACADCMVGVLLGPPEPEWDEAELRAIDLLVEAGLVPRLRLLRGPGEVVREPLPDRRRRAG